MVAMLVAGMSEYNFGDSEFLMLLLVLITLPFAAARDRRTPDRERPALPPLPPARARDIIEGFAAGLLLVIGDVMLDRFLFGRVSRISPEAPVPVVVHDHDEFRLGGAANVAHNIAALGGRELIAVIGDDETAAFLKAELAAMRSHAPGLVTDPERRTTTKVRVVTNRNQQVARIDYESAEVSDSRRRRGHGRRSSRASTGAGAAGLGLPEGRRHPTLDGAADRVRATASGLPLLVDPKVPHLEFYSGRDAGDTEPRGGRRPPPSRSIRTTMLARRQRCRASG